MVYSLTQQNYGFFSGYFHLNRELFKEDIYNLSHILDNLGHEVTILHSGTMIF